MPSNLEVTVQLAVDGEPIRGFPIRRSFAVDELLGTLRYEKATGGGFSALPGLSELSVSKQFLLLESDKALTLRFASGAAGDLTLGANALVLVLNAAHTADIQIDNQSGSTAIIQASTGGT